MSKTGIYGLVYDAPSRGGNNLGRIEAENFSFETLAVGGCWSASLSKSMPIAIAEDWYEQGLGRVIKFYDESGVWVWEGFVNTVTVNAGDISEVRGPLMAIVNRANCTYTPRDFSVYPPVDGSQTITTIVEDELSQNNYGIIEGIVSAGTCPEETAIKVQTRYLNENSIPKTTSTISISPGSAQVPTVTIELLGNVNFLMRYIYDLPGVSTMSFLSDKIIDILSADVNGIISTNYNYIEENLYLVNDTEDKLRYAWDIISELLSIGNDTDDTRRIFGIYESGLAKYNSIPTTIMYEYQLGWKQEVRLSSSGIVVRPWLIQPGQWITIPDVLIGRNVPSTNLNSDPRTYFIESVQYTAPYSVSLSGGQTDRLSQILAKITYTGGIY